LLYRDKKVGIAFFVRQRSGGLRKYEVHLCSA
jgi:hypothetical protein